MDVVETFLLKRIDNALRESSNHFLSSDCLYNEFIDLRKRIAQNKEKLNPVTRKEKLYLLNNLVDEWQMILNKRNPCAPQTIRIANNIRGSLKKIKSELETRSVGEQGEGRQDGKQSNESELETGSVGEQGEGRQDGKQSNESELENGTVSEQGEGRQDGKQSIESELETGSVGEQGEGRQDGKQSIESELEAGSVGEQGEGRQDGKQSIESGKWNSHSVDRKKIYGIEDESMVMERLLVGKERKVGFKAIGIVGVSGAGKTTFCRVAFNNQEVRKYFAPRLWVHLSKKPMGEEAYKKEVVKSILMCLGYEETLINQIGDKEPDGLRKLLLALRLKLKGKKYLIVLDGVWNSDKGLEDFCSSLGKDDEGQHQLAYGLPKGDGGTVIVISRSKKLAADMVGEKNLHRLGPLADDKSCWEIFSDTVGVKKLPQHLKEREFEIVKQCFGLPLVAKMLGQIVLQNKRA